MKIRGFLNDLMAKGRCCFSEKDIQDILRKSQIAIWASIRRLKAKGEIVSPYRGFYVIVTPEYRSLGCLPPDHFIPFLMEYLKIPYYVCLLSAARYYGAAHQQPQEFQVMIPKYLPPIRCGAVSSHFVVKKDLILTQTREFYTSRGSIKVSTPEETVIDLMRYPHQSGGIELVISILRELKEQLDSRKLLKIIQKKDELPYVQRLGFFLSFIGDENRAKELENFLMKHDANYVLLCPGLFSEESSISKRWKVKINLSLVDEADDGY